MVNHSHSAIHRPALTVDPGHRRIRPATFGPLRTSDVPFGVIAARPGMWLGPGREPVRRSGATRGKLSHKMRGDRRSATITGQVTPMKLLLAALTSLAVIIGMGVPARADSTDDAFIASLQAAGFTFSDAGQTITAAHYVCHAADGGTAMADIAKAIQSKDSALSDDKAAKFTAIAATAYCPQALSSDSSSSSAPTSAASAPSNAPSAAPSSAPSSAPSNAPSSAPSSAPSTAPTATPSTPPSNDRAVPRSTIS